MNETQWNEPSDEHVRDTLDSITHQNVPFGIFTLSDDISDLHGITNDLPDNQGQLVNSAELDKLTAF